MHFNHEMKFPLLQVIDHRNNDYIHCVGDDVHDTLYVDDNGGIHYRNLQNSEGTEYGGYAFVAEDNQCGAMSIKFANFDEILEIYVKSLDNASDVENNYREKIKPSLERYLEELKKTRDSEQGIKVRKHAIIHDGYMRDAQVFTGDPKDLDNDSDDEDQSENYADVKYPSLYLGLYEGETEQEIKEIAAKIHGVHSDTITLLD